MVGFDSRILLQKGNHPTRDGFLFPAWEGSRTHLTATVRWTVAPEGLTEGLLYFLPTGENANRLPYPAPNRSSTILIVELFILLFTRILHVCVSCAAVTLGCRCVWIWLLRFQFPLICLLSDVYIEYRLQRAYQW